MVRLLLIRHAQSQQNAYMESLFRDMHNKKLPAASFNRAMRNGPKGTDAGADALLTSLGKSQAQRLGLTYAPLLVSKAKQGKLKVFVSPFTRCMMTADPLMKELRKEIPSLEATVLPAIMESGGLTERNDFQNFDQIDELNKLGKRDEAIQLLKSIQWKAQGMSGIAMLQQFPWINLHARDSPLTSTEITQIPWAEVEENNKPWWSFGFESTKRAHRRVNAVGKWLTEEVSRNVSGESGDDVVVVMVCHGGTIQVRR